MWKTVTALVAVASLAVATGVKAEEWPSRPVTMINPFAAGGPNDVLARLRELRHLNAKFQQAICEVIILGLNQFKTNIGVTPFGLHNIGCILNFSPDYMA